ncbi:hypothetical protein [Flavobacterium sp.]|uniref:hypothetical protein n=1 Tax=Flavobacterium sp. TaxID=239 RepID=UPI0026274B6B|nr:hypothetical protein [Flavobacterium sp.]
MSANKTLLFLIIAACSGCSSQPSKISVAFDFPKNIKEASALEYIAQSKLFWTLEDSGNDANLYALDKSGKRVNTVAVDVVNNDWEELASDPEGNLYIGDFGNNDNERKDLCIYKIDAADLTGTNAAPSEKISFFYSQQKEFPPRKSERFYDAEAFFYFRGNFYLFTKNRSSKFDGTTLLYRVPAVPGNHAAILMGKFRTCTDYKHCAITDADISDDGTTIALLSSSQVWLFKDFKNDDFLKGRLTTIDLQDFTQKEGICFNGNRIFIADEKDKHTGGKVYELNKP